MKLSLVRFVSSQAKDFLFISLNSNLKVQLKHLSPMSQVQVQTSHQNIL